MEVRHAVEADLEQLNDLYNHYVRETPITFDLVPFTMEQRVAWFAEFGTSGRHQLFVAVDGTRVLGYAHSKGFRPKAAYEPSVETTVYVGHEDHGRGVGTALYRILFEALATEDVNRALAGITLPNAASEALHARFGFELVGVFTEVGRKFERFWDVAWYERPV